jgi:hypothetical protein
MPGFDEAGWCSPIKVQRLARPEHPRIENDFAGVLNTWFKVALSAPD